MTSESLPPLHRNVAAGLGIILLVVLWHIIVSAGLISKILLPAPVPVFMTIGKMLFDARFWADLQATIGVWLIGLGIGTLGGGIIGLFASLNRYAWAVLEPWIEFVRSLPSIVLVPMVSLFLGVGGLSRLASCSIVVFAIMASSAAQAVKHARQNHLRIAKAWRARPVAVVFVFILPAVLSHLVVALRTAMPIALIVAVACDMLIATDRGLGKTLMDSLAVFDSQRAYAVIIVIGGLGYVAAQLGVAIERRALHWAGL